MSSQLSSAALTGALLANKGAAAPSNTVSAFLEELPPPDRTPLRPTLATGETRESAQHDAMPRGADDGLRSGGQGKRAKLSVRLDPDRHLRLKLAAAHLRRSSQTIMIEALDAFLADMAPALATDCACLNKDG